MVSLFSVVRSRYAKPHWSQLRPLLPASILLPPHLPTVSYNYEAHIEHHLFPNPLVDLFHFLWMRNTITHGNQLHPLSPASSLYTPLLPSSRTIAPSPSLRVFVGKTRFLLLLLPQFVHK